MRSSISAQSWDSVPPAPGWISSMASWLSSSPESSMTSSVSSSRASRLSCCFARDSRASSSPLSTASSSHSCMSSWQVLRALRRETSSSSWRFSRSRGVRASGLSQALGRESSVSMAARRCSLAATSKTPPKVVETLVEGLATGTKITELQHGTIEGLKVRGDACPRRCRARAGRRPAAARARAHDRRWPPVAGARAPKGYFLRTGPRGRSHGRGRR